MKNFFYILIIVFVVVSLFIVKDDIFRLWEVIQNPESNPQEVVLEALPPTIGGKASQDIKPETTVALQVKKAAPSAPGAIKVIKPEVITAVDLSLNKIVELTNIERASAGLKPLVLNIKLASSTQNKTTDMLSQQYFEHIGPDGKSASNWIEAENYAYVVIGENLAMGDFSNENDLVQAWMNSPGHRANILNKHFTEIGVGALKGPFEGRQIWISVQHFGRPLADCPIVDQALKDKIEAQRASLDGLGYELEIKKIKIDSEIPFGPEYEVDIGEYNSKVKVYNDLIQLIKTDTNIYNQSVQAFNACVAS